MRYAWRSCVKTLMLPPVWRKSLYSPRYHHSVWRLKFINAAKALRESGETPPGVHNPEWYQVRGVAIEIKRGENWYEASKGVRKVIRG